MGGPAADDRIQNLRAVAAIREADCPGCACPGIGVFLAMRDVVGGRGEGLSDLLFSQVGSRCCQCSGCPLRVVVCGSGDERVEGTFAVGGIAQLGCEHFGCVHEISLEAADEFALSPLTVGGGSALTQLQNVESRLTGATAIGDSGIFLVYGDKRTRAKSSAGTVRTRLPRRRRVRLTQCGPSVGMHRAKSMRLAKTRWRCTDCQMDRG
ncbi:MAG: hypothetical protein ACI9MB_004143 [Verrucomicrobiales bacterium]|jgi:hypothetical protein